jgi:hypothetical protein
MSNDNENNITPEDVNQTDDFTNEELLIKATSKADVGENTLLGTGGMTADGGTNGTDDSDPYQKRLNPILSSLATTRDYSYKDYDTSIYNRRFISSPHRVNTLDSDIYVEGLTPKTGMVWFPSAVFGYFQTGGYRIYEKSLVPVVGIAGTAINWYHTASNAFTNAYNIVQLEGSQSEVTPKFRAENKAFDMKAFIFYVNNNPDIRIDTGDTHLVGLSLMAMLAKYTTHYSGDMSWYYKAYLTVPDAGDVESTGAAVINNGAILPLNFQIIGDGTFEDETWAFPMHPEVDEDDVRDRWTHCYVVSEKTYALHSDQLGDDYFSYWDNAAQDIITARVVTIPITYAMLQHPLTLAFWTFANCGYPWSHERFQYDFASWIYDAGFEASDFQGLESIWNYLYWDRDLSNDWANIIYVVVDVMDNRVPGGKARRGLHDYRWYSAVDLYTYYDANNNQFTTPGVGMNLHDIFIDALSHTVYSVKEKIAALKNLLTYWDLKGSDSMAPLECRNFLAMYGPRYTEQMFSDFTNSAERVGHFPVVLDPTGTDINNEAPWMTSGDDRNVREQTTTRVANFGNWVTTACGMYGDTIYNKKQGEGEDVPRAEVSVPNVTTTFPGYSFRTLHAYMVGFLQSDNSKIMEQINYKYFGDQLKVASAKYAHLFDRYYQEVDGRAIYEWDTVWEDRGIDNNIDELSMLTNNAISTRECTSMIKLSTSSWDGNNIDNARAVYNDLMNRSHQRIPFSWYNLDYEPDTKVDFSDLNWEFNSRASLFSLFVNSWDAGEKNMKELRALGNTLLSTEYVSGDNRNLVDDYKWFSSYMSTVVYEYQHYGLIHDTSRYRENQYREGGNDYNQLIFYYPMHNIPMFVDSDGGTYMVGKNDPIRLDHDVGRLTGAVGIVTGGGEQTYAPMRSKMGRPSRKRGLNLKV